MSESTEQQAVIQWFRLQHPLLRLISYPNGQWVQGSGVRRAGLIRKYKAEGMTNGVSDLFLCVPKGPHGGLWIEMKDKGKKEASLSKEQKGWLADMIRAGYQAKWASGFMEAKKIIEDYLNGQH